METENLKSGNAGDLNSKANEHLDTNNNDDDDDNNNNYNDDNKDDDNNYNDDDNDDDNAIPKIERKKLDATKGRHLSTQFGENNLPLMR